MKIVHINNTAGVASVLARQQNNTGHTAEVFVFNSATQRQFGGKKFNYRWPLSRWNFFKKIKEFDLWHYHYPYGSLKKNLEMRRNFKPFLKHYHGDDLRGRLDTDYCLVSTPDLLKHAPNGKWLPNPIDIEGIKSMLTEISYENKLPKVLFYPKVYESNIHSQELEIKRTVLAELEVKRKLVVIPILDLPYKKALNKIANCDIVVGKILPIMGWIGRTELEAMALGKPVIAYVSDELYEKYKPPVFRTSEKSFQSDLEYLLEDTNTRNNLVKLGLDYVKENHSVHNVCNLLDNYYTSI
jgi:hypothetical protein